MSFFERLTGSAGNKKRSPYEWIYPEKSGELSRLLERAEKPVLIYKHSDRCATCFMTRRAVEEVMAHYAGKAEFLFIDVIRNRDLSTAIARDTAIRHESPQVIIFSSGEAVFNTSHGNIRADVLNGQIERFVNQQKLGA